MTRWAAVAVVVGSLGALVSAQTRPLDRSRTLVGEVVDQADGRPLSGVHLEFVASPDTSVPTALSDTFGRFAVALTDHEYQVIARKAGFSVLRTSVSHGAPVALRLEERAVFSGRIVDTSGEAIVDAQVTAARHDGTARETTTTDDRGEYRLSVPPGMSWVLSVETTGVESPGRTIGPGRLALDPPEHTLYFPGTALVERAERVRLQPGEVRAGMDFVVTVEQSVRQPFRGLESIPMFSSAIAPGDAGTDAEGVVQGRVTDGAGRGLANALVLLANERAGSSVRMVHADASGRFEFRQVPPGWFRAMASKPGYAPDEARPTIGAQQTRPADVALRLTPWASISGRVVNEFGAPVQRARVQVMAPQFVEGRRVLAFASSVDPLTDDRGVYRVYGLEPGTYVVSAELADGRSGGRTDYRRSYFGSAGPTDATLLTVEAGQEVGDVDVRLVRSAAYRVTGRVLDATGQPGFRGAVAMLPRQRDAAVVSVPVSAQVDGDGRFEFRDITDGEYVVQAYRGRVTSTTEGEFGAVGVTVSGGDVTGVALTTRGGSSVSGEVVFDTLDPSGEPPRANVELSVVPSDLDRAPGNWARAGVGPDWRFSLGGISGPRRLIPTELPSGWGLKSIRVNGVDVGDRPLELGTASESVTDVEVVLTDRPSELRGRVTDDSGSGVAGASILVFSTEASRWYLASLHVRRTITQDDGTFAVAGMPSGTYYVAVASSGNAELPDQIRVRGGDIGWQDPVALEALTSSAAVVTLVESTRTSVLLRR